MSKACCAHDERENHQYTHTNKDEEAHEHVHDEEAGWKQFMPAIFSFVLLVLGITFNYFLKQRWFSDWLQLVWYLAAYIPVGWPVLKEAWQSIVKGDIFSEFLLMGLATVGAFAIGEYPEGVAVMLFYAVGETLQGMAVSKAKRNIKSLLDQRPDEVTIIIDGVSKKISAKKAQIDDVILLKPGEKLAVDGELLSDHASFNTAALTGESKPDTKYKGETVLAGMINLNTLAQVKVQAVYADSKLGKILKLVQNATSQKAPTELFIRKFARFYTPIVVFLAIGICLLPYFFVGHYQFRDWLYRALIFLVVSCPCALVISIPLGYFGGIGAASRKGILFKGSNFLDVLAICKQIVLDKTGTLTEGVFKVEDIHMEAGFDNQSRKTNGAQKVEDIHMEAGFDEAQTLKWVNALEARSTHPVASAIHQYVGEAKENIGLAQVEEMPGHGLKAIYDGKRVLVGNPKLLDKYEIGYPASLKQNPNTVIAFAIGEKFAGYLTISDRIKTDAKQAITDLQQLGIAITLLSGDKEAVVKAVAETLNIKTAFGNLLPEDKVGHLKSVKNKGLVAFVGDGVNDAPVVALADVGIAMGGLGSDATIETADVVIQDDKPSKIATAIAISRQTKKIVWQNIGLAFVVKAVVLILGAGGLATMWEAVFADVGVALLAVLNAVRIQRMKF